MFKLRRLLLPALLALALVIPADAARPQRRTKLPNLLLIVAEDLGPGDLGCYGQDKIKTPNLDRLAAEGMRFTQAYAGSPASGPSRCALITGRQSGRTSVRAEGQSLAATEVTLAEVLRNNGYRTGMIGNWLLGGADGHPNQQGFETFFGTLDQENAANHHPAFLWRDKYPAKPFNDTERYSPLWMFRGATNFIRVYEDQAFFLYLAPPLARANPALGTNGFVVPSLGDYARKPWPAPERARAAQIAFLDKWVGEFLDSLRARKLEEDTVIVFTSATGPRRQAGSDPAFFQSAGLHRTTNSPLSEGSLRVPLLIRWPGKVKAGATNDLPVALWDLLPTLAPIADVKTPRGLDGLNFGPSLYGLKQPRQHEFLYWELREAADQPPQRAVRMGDWKAIQPAPDQPLQLFHLPSDPGETNNVAGSQGEVVKRLEELLATATKPPADSGKEPAPPKP